MKTESVLDPVIVNLMIREVQKQNQFFDIFSWEFFFEPVYAGIRSQHPLRGGTSSKRTLLSILMHEGMDDKRRAIIFPKTFDLGNLREIPPSKCNNKSLLEDLGLPYGINDPIKHINSGIKRLTGRSINDYYKVDKPVALKVQKTLYYLTRYRKETTIFTLLEGPEGKKSGLEFRESYTHSQSSEFRYLVSDVREYFGAELSTQRIIQIQQAFESVLTSYEKAIQVIRYRTTSVDTGYNKSFRDFYDRLQSSIESYRHSSVPDSPVRLDEALYIHISSLPFRHFAENYPSLHTIGIAHPPLVSLAEKIHVEEYEAMRIPISDIPLVLKNKAEFFCSIVSTALSGQIDAKILDKYALSVSAVLDRVELFEPGQSMIPEERDTDLLRIVTAICCIHLEHNQGTLHMPYWRGQGTVGDSLLESLKSPFSDKTVYEEHTQIWRIRLNWLCANLSGKADRFKERSTLELLILRRFSEIARLQNVEAIEEATRDLFEHIASSCQFTLSD